MSEFSRGVLQEYADAGGFADALRCDSCGYRLTGLSADGDCPECGTAVTLSRHGWRLRTASPLWLRVVATGAALLMLATLAFGWVLLDLIHLQWLAEDSTRHVLWGSVWVVLLLGGLGITARLRRWQTVRRASIRRLVARWAAVGAIGWGAHLWSISLIPARLREELDWVDEWLRQSQPGMWLLGALATIATFEYVRFLARRLPARGLALHLRLAGWLLALPLVLFFVSRVQAHFLGPSGLMAMAGGSSTSLSWVGLLYDWNQALLGWSIYFGLPVILPWAALMLGGFAWCAWREARLAPIDPAQSAIGPQPASTRFWPWRWTWRRAFAAGALLLMVGAYVPLHASVVQPRFTVWRANRLIEQYQHEPDRATCETISSMLSRGVLPESVGDRALRVLTRPRVQMRTSYPAHQPPGVVVRRPFHASIDVKDGEQKMARYVGDRMQSSGSSGGSQIGPSTRQLKLFSELLAPDGQPTREFPPGVYTARLVFTCEMVPVQHTHRRYETRVEVPLRFRLVPPQQAEQIKLRSNPKLEQAMRRAITAKQTPNRGGSFRSNNRNGSWRGGLKIERGDLPENVAMSIRYEDKSGRVVRIDNRHWVWRKDVPRMSKQAPMFDIAPQLPPGQYRGYLVLTPDPDAARPYASIKTIWGGELRFPMRFRVR